MKKSIILIGFMGAGKTTVGRCLARKLGLSMIDTDYYIEQTQKMKISEIFAQYGEAYFRDLETKTIQHLIKQGENYIVSCGGGMVLRSENRDLLKTLGTVIYLRVRPETVASRLKGDTTRPLLQGTDAEEKIKNLLTLREGIYEAAADVQVDTDGLLPEEICVKILNQI